MAKHFQFRIGATVSLLLYYMQVMQVNFQFLFKNQEIKVDKMIFKV